MEEHIVKLEAEDLEAVSGGVSAGSKSGEALCAGGCHDWAENWHSFIRVNPYHRLGRRVKCSRCGTEGFQFDDGNGWYNVSYEAYVKEAGNSNISAIC